MVKISGTGVVDAVSAFVEGDLRCDGEVVAVFGEQFLQLTQIELHTSSTLV